MDKIFIPLPSFFHHKIIVPLTCVAGGAGCNGVRMTDVLDTQADDLDIPSTCSQFCLLELAADIIIGDGERSDVQ